MIYEMNSAGWGDAISDPGRIVSFPVGNLVSPEENWRVYRRPSVNDQATRQLAASMRKEGMLEPLVIDRVGIVLSGNRRKLAAEMAGLNVVPCRMLQIDFNGLSTDQKLKLLARYNVDQRQKSREEQVREAIVSVSDADIAERLTARKSKMLDKVNVSDPTDIKPNQKAVRRDPRKRRGEFLDAVIRVLKDEEKYLPMSIRAVHYRLCNLSFLKDMSNPGSRYRNDLASYKALSRLLMDARVWGFVPWDAIFDETRPVRQWRTSTSLKHYLRGWRENLFGDYWLDVMATQPFHIEVVVEKMTVMPTLQSVASEFTIPILACRGYGSGDARQAMVGRFMDSGKDQLLLLCMSDLDPEGVNIPKQLGGSLVDDFDLPEHSFTVRRVGLNASHIERLNIPPLLEAKKTSSRYREFRDEYGANAYELESLPTPELQSILRNAIIEALDMDEYNFQREREKGDIRTLAALAGVIGGNVLEFLDGMEDDK